MATGMMSNQMASEIIRAMGGKVTKARLRAFQRFCDALVKHVQNNMVVTSQGVDPQGGVVTSTSIKVQ
jgi:hypothetical protein